MRSEFLELVNEEKAKGKTILMSSHLFDEVERSCDFVAIIKEGKIIARNSITDIMREGVKEFKLEFISAEDCERFGSEAENTYTISSRCKEKNQIFVKVDDKDINRFIRSLNEYQLKNMTEIKYSLEQYFKEFY
jgi:ABC-2 type transport system ATP-binding protein